MNRIKHGSPGFGFRRNEQLYVDRQDDKETYQVVNSATEVLHKFNMSKKITLSALLLFVLCRCQSQCDLQGEWHISHGRLTENYEMARSYSNVRITFSKDSIELASGSFYNILDLYSDTYPTGRYPFVYYGKKEGFKLTKDSLYVYSKPYKTWDAFKILCLTDHTLRLVGTKDTLNLVRLARGVTPEICTIKYVKAHINGGSLDSYGINYKVEYTRDDKLVYDELDSLNGSFDRREIKLKSGSFKEICSGFNGLNLRKVKKLYSTEVSDFSTVNVEIGLENGTTVRTAIQNQECPQDLWIALIPVLYGHQQLIYREVAPVRWR